MSCSLADLIIFLPAEAKARGGLSEAEAAVLKAARAKSLGASKEAVAINAAWKGAALLLMQLLPVPAEVHMRLAAGEASIFTLCVLCRPVLPLSGPESQGSRVWSLIALQGGLCHLQTNLLAESHPSLPSPAAYLPPKASLYHSLPLADDGLLSFTTS